MTPDVEDLQPHRSPLFALLTIAEAASALNCSEVTVRRRIARGELRAVRIGAEFGCAVRALPTRCADC
jgi:excisionase family DNA binding protein